ncbi:CLUMA_CG011812, isoform A [Clunio marinus]|uniref:CLUMA_CG011812, isoform A n=1 Tax=Clunio marinus TaxID=568069 RepID=A0A1J1IDW0_9DIPT|nr:CLUMA_CG011812, isoform A [Clunio marinus]
MNDLKHLLMIKNGYFLDICGVKNKLGAKDNYEILREKSKKSLQGCVYEKKEELLTEANKRNCLRPLH